MWKSTVKRYHAEKNSVKRHNKILQNLILQMDDFLSLGAFLGHFMISRNLFVRSSLSSSLFSMHLRIFSLPYNFVHKNFVKSTFLILNVFTKVFQIRENYVFSTTSVTYYKILQWKGTCTYVFSRKLRYIFQTRKGERKLFRRTENLQKIT